MDQYILRLSECQENEDRLRSEREEILRRHEKELEELNTRLETVSKKRNEIIEEFKQFLDGNLKEPSSPTSITSKDSEETAAVAAFQDTADSSPLASPKTPPAVPISSQPLKSKTRPFRIVQRLKTSKSAASITNYRCLESPTTTQIESMLSQVRDHQHSLDNGTINKCIDLLSAKITTTNSNTESVAAVSEPEAKEASESPCREDGRQRRRVETAEERRERIRKVLLENPSMVKVGKLSRSPISFSALELNEKRSPVRTMTGAAARYRSDRSSRMRRNNSLSPLRFSKSCAEEKVAREEDSLRRYKSDQQLDELAGSDDESLSATVDDSLADSDDVEVKKEEDHLLAPSKVIKSQELFKQVFFPADSNEPKPLLSREEIARSRSNVFKAGSRPQSDISQDSADTGSDSTDRLRVDYLSHLRRNSVSPETRQRERELNSLNNTGKFKCYQDFWETKTKETIDKKKKFQAWQQNSSSAVPSAQPNPVIQTSEVANQKSAGNSASEKARAYLDASSQRKLHKPETVPTVLSVPEIRQQSLSPSSLDSRHSESDAVLEKLRHFQQDIRQRKLKHQQMLQEQQQQQQQQQQQEMEFRRPKPMANSKSFELIQPKLAPVTIVQPNSPEVPARNARIRLIRSNSREEADSRLFTNGFNGKCHNNLDVALMRRKTFATKNTKSADLVSQPVAMRSTYF